MEEKMDKLYSIGTIIEVDNVKCMIVGYQMVEKTKIDEYVNCYVITPYPIGFTDLGDLNIIPIDMVKDSLFDGFIDEKCRGFLENKKIIFDGSKDNPPSKAKFIVELLSKRMNENEMEDE